MYLCKHISRLKDNKHKQEREGKRFEKKTGDKNNYSCVCISVICSVVYSVVFIPT